jgi:hypothetical protein
VHLEIVALLGHELTMGAFLDNAAFIHDNNGMGIPNNVQTLF